MSRYEQPLIVTAVLLVLTVLWEVSMRVFEIPPFILPSPSTVIAVLVKSHVKLLSDSLYTMQATLAGFALAVIVGVLFAIGIAQSRFVEKISYTLLVSM